MDFQHAQKIEAASRSSRAHEQKEPIIDQELLDLAQRLRVWPLL